MPWDRSRYPKDWRDISLRIRARAAGRCECAGECGRPHETPCEARHLEPHPQTDSRVILTVAHLWRGACAPCHAIGRKCGELGHLKAMCQACHLAYDLPQHIANRRASRRAKKASGDLFDGTP